MPENRPNPDELLVLAQKEEAAARRGKLKIFFGAAPGVGKTYTMLQDAIARRVEGLDVVIGVVESHGRTETSELIKGFEILPRTKITYRERTLEEFDIDGALARHPAIIIVDEMAHTNIAGCRHNKRWQDIKELIDRGIDVYTTLNVQHIESLNDIVAQITGVRVTETVPDSIIDQANIIELVDLSPVDLLKRMEEGKVYFPEQAKLAIDGFFRQANLVALRELALRYIAQRVNTEVQQQRLTRAEENIWPTNERLLVCVSADDSSAKLVRAARRMAARLQAEWFAVYVESPRIQISDQQREIVNKNLRLAEQLGATTVTLPGRDVVKEIIAYATLHNISKIVLSKKIRPRWKDLLFGSLVDELVRHSKDIDIYIIRDDGQVRKKPVWFSKTIRSPFKAYVTSSIYVLLTTILCEILSFYIATTNIVMLYLLMVVLISMRGQRGPAILASILSVACYDFLFIPPIFSFGVRDFQYIITLIVMLFASQTISYLTLLAREQTENARSRERYLTELQNLSKKLSSHWAVNDILKAGVEYIAEILDSEVYALIPDKNNKLEVVASSAMTSDFFNEKQRAVAQWTYELGQPAGLGTETLQHSDALYIPLIGSQNTMGVLRIKPNVEKYHFNSEQLRVLQSCVNQIAMAVDVADIQAKSQEIQVEMNKERMLNNLLSSVSHDLRTPLTTIMGASSSLVETTQNSAKELAATIYNQSTRLDRLINNLLQTVSLDSGELKLKKELHSLDEVIGSSLSVLSNSLRSHPVKIDIPRNLPFVKFDSVLLEQVIVNLLENAINYTAKTTPIDIAVMQHKNKIEVIISDEGLGVPVDDIEKIFTKFYRTERAKNIPGSGLGLAICQTIIQAHGGEIWAKARHPKGVSFHFTLPLEG